MQKIFSVFESLRFRDYRLFIIGAFISFVGSQMQVVAISWHVYQLTKSAANLGLIGLFGFLPILFFAPFAGVIIDSVDRKKLILINQLLFTLVTALFAISVFLHYDNQWIIYLVLFINATLIVIDLPARQTIIPSIIPKSHLISAFSLYTISRQSAIILGPTLAGFLIAWYGVSVVYLINALSFFIFFILFLFVTIPKKEEKAAIHISAVMEGIRYIKHSPLLYSTMILDFFVNFFAASTVIFPIFATMILHTDSRGLGLLYAAPSIGAVLAGLIVGIVFHVRRQGLLLLFAVALYGLATVGFGLSHNFYFSLFCLAVVGGADMISMAVRQAISQLVTPDYIRGRMNALNMMFFLGGPFLGEAEAGFAAALLGAPLSVVAGGLGAIFTVCIVGVFVPQLVKYNNSTTGVK